MILGRVLALVVVVPWLWPTGLHAQSDALMAADRQGNALREAGHYERAIPFLRKALELGEHEFGPDHPFTAALLGNLADLFQLQGRDADAEPMFKRSLAIREHALGPNHPEVGRSLDQLGGLYQSQGRFAEAEPLYQRALAIAEKAFGPDHPDVAATVANLAGLYESQGRYAEAEPLYKRALAIREQVLGPDHPEVGYNLTQLAALHQIRGRFVEAEPIFRRALAVLESALGPDHPEVVAAHTNLAGLYQHQRRFAEAEPLYKRALAIAERTHGPDHPAIAAAHTNLAGLYRDQGRFADAELHYTRALAIDARSLGPDHPSVAANPARRAEPAPPVSGPSAEPRVALVIGNSAYRSAPLANPANDARLIAGTLRGVGFEVVELIDGDQKAMKVAILEFGDRLEEAGRDAVGLFYYAGHGLQVGNQNFLVPLNSAIKREKDVAVEAVSAAWVLGQMEFAANRVNFVILDACRNNPLVRSFRSPTRGLARMDAPRGSLIAYSTAPGKVARDGAGANSPYSLALARAMRTPGVPVEKMFKLVRDTVMGETRDEQVPWEESSLTGADFYFNPAAAAAARPAPIPAPAPAAGVETERLFWESIKDSDNPATFEAYLAEYPNGAFATLARIRLSELQSTPEVVATAEPATVREAPRHDEQAELAFWDAIKDSDNPADYRAYLEAYPAGRFAALARVRAEPKMPAAAVVAQISAAGDWQDSGVRVRPGERYRIRATGTWSIGLICGQTDASGSGVGFLCAGDPWGIGAVGSTLIGRVGEDGDPFRVGSEFNLDAGGHGILYLRCYDLIPFDNSGTITVHITALSP